MRSTTRLVTGASNEKTLKLVPTTPLVVTVSRLERTAVAAKFFRQLTVVALVHDVVVHGSEASCAVGVEVLYPKFRPEIVTETAAVRWKFGINEFDTAGASNEKNLFDVPTTALTCIRTIRPGCHK